MAWVGPAEVAAEVAKVVVDVVVGGAPEELVAGAVVVEVAAASGDNRCAQAVSVPPRAIARASTRTSWVRCGPRPLDLARAVFG